MTNPKREIEFSAQAELDHQTILLNSLVEWGVGQLDQYEHAISEALERMCRFPAIGRVYPGLPAGMRAILVEHHLIIYTEEGRSIFIHRILHERQDIASAITPKDK